jgi:predicted amidohydrolase
MEIALFHLAAVPGAVKQNQNLAETALQAAADAAAEWAVTPKLATTECRLSESISIAAFAEKHRLVAFLSIRERGEASRLADRCGEFQVSPSMLSLHSESFISEKLS